MSRDFADLRVYKGKDPFSLLTLGCLLFSLGITSLLYLEKIIERSLFLSSSLIVSGLVFLAFGSLRMRFPWLRLKGKFHVMLGIFLLTLGMSTLIGVSRTIATISVITGILIVGWGLRRLRRNSS